MVKEVTESNFDEEVINCEIPVLIDFWAEWCGPCRMLTPILDQISLDMAGKVKVVKMNIEKSPEIGSKYNVRSLPTLCVLKKGEQVAVKIGLHTKEKIVSWVNESLQA